MPRVPQKPGEEGQEPLGARRCRGDTAGKRRGHLCDKDAATSLLPRVKTR